MPDNQQIVKQMIEDATNGTEEKEEELLTEQPEDTEFESTMVEGDETTDETTGGEESQPTEELPSIEDGLKLLEKYDTPDEVPQLSEPEQELKQVTDLKQQYDAYFEQVNKNALEAFGLPAIQVGDKLLYQLSEDELNEEMTRLSDLGRPTEANRLQHNWNGFQDKLEQHRKIEADYIQINETYIQTKDGYEWNKAADEFKKALPQLLPYGDEVDAEVVRLLNAPENQALAQGGVEGKARLIMKALKSRGLLDKLKPQSGSQQQTLENDSPSAPDASLSGSKKTSGKNVYTRAELQNFMKLQKQGKLSKEKLKDVLRAADEGRIA